MSEIVGTGSEASLERAGWFYRHVAKEHTLAFVACSVDIKAIKTALADVGFPSEYAHVFGNPYLIAFRALMDAVAQHLPEIGIDQQIDFIFDDRPERDQVVRGWRHCWSACLEMVLSSLCHLIQKSLFK
jgi:hypothetical protein